jgi:hypothetical protein
MLNEFEFHLKVSLNNEVFKYIYPTTRILRNVRSQNSNKFQTTSTPTITPSMSGIQFSHCNF